MAKKGKSILSQRDVLSRIMRYIRPHLPALLASLAFSLVVVALTLYVPILIGRAIDCIVAAGQVDFDTLRRTLLSVGVCIGITAAVTPLSCPPAFTGLLRRQQEVTHSQEVRSLLIPQLPPW